MSFNELRSFLQPYKSKIKLDIIKFDIFTVKILNFVESIQPFKSY